MTRSERLRPVADMKQREQINSARVLSASIEELKKQQERLAELQHYRDEYLNKYRRMSNEGASIERIRHYQDFISRLDQSLVVQEQKVIDTKRQLEEKKVGWKQARARSDAFDKVVDRYREEESQQKEQRLQKEVDDQALRNSVNKDDSHH